MSTVTSTATSSPAAAAPQPKQSLPRRVADTFVSPGALFAGFHHHTPWVGPLLISIVVGVAIILAMPQELWVEQAREAMQRQGSAPPDADPAQLARYAPLMGAAGVVMGQPIFAFLTAAILLLLFSVFLGGQATYKQYLAVTTHSMLVQSLGALLLVPLILIQRSVEVRLSLALLTPFLDAASYLFRFLNLIDVFTLWVIVLLGLGAHVLNRRMSWAAAAGAILGVYLLVVAGLAVIPR